MARSDDAFPRRRLHEERLTGIHEVKAGARQAPPEAAPAAVGIDFEGGFPPIGEPSSDDSPALLVLVYPHISSIPEGAVEARMPDRCRDLEQRQVRLTRLVADVGL